MNKAQYLTLVSYFHHVVATMGSSDLAAGTILTANFHLVLVII